MGASSSTVLVLDTDRSRAAKLGQRLEFMGYSPIAAAAEDAPRKLAPVPGIALVIGESDGKPAIGRALNEVSRRQPRLPFLLMSDGASSGRLLDELHDNFAEHPTWRIETPIRRAEVGRLLRRAARYSDRPAGHRLTGRSRPIRELRETIDKVADFDTSVLITGESGTGKELVAQSIHELSSRAGKPFVPINCGAIPRELLESELFGHLKGAFTGAISDRIGRFELAEGGTLFLDEVGDMCPSMQVKLLRVLQERCFERIGSNRTQGCDVRIIAATHCNLPAAVERGDFREDLFYRLNVFPIETPPLRQRPGDLPLLLDEFLTRHGGTGGPRVAPAALAALARYRWPGNVRELSNLAERLAILKPAGRIELDDLPARYRPAAPDGVPAAGHGCGALPLGQASLKDQLAAVERDLIRQAVDSCGGVVAKAARLLGMRRTTLVEKLSRYEIH